MNNDKVIKETGTVPGTNINTECYIIYEKSNGIHGRTDGQCRTND